MNLRLPEHLDPGEWAPEIASRVGATTYVNPVGGLDLFSVEEFHRRSLALEFLKVEEFVYSTAPFEFVPNLSILDVLMWNSPEVVRDALRAGSTIVKPHRRAPALSLGAKASNLVRGLRVDRNLIFDIGLHRGYDANFYLRKGFRVVGLEAVKGLCDTASTLNHEFVESKQLEIVEKALYHQSNLTVEFFTNPDKDDWGSLFQGAAEKGGGKATKIAVETITLNELVQSYGVPYYIKCDIENGDAIFAEQLSSLKELPSFVSLEATQLDDIARLRCSGYDRFQLINQYMNPFTAAPEPAREGVYASVKFSHEMSGLFGKELNPKEWIVFAEAAKIFLDWYDLRRRNPNLAIGWLDIHACKANSV